MNDLYIDEFATREFCAYLHGGFEYYKFVILRIIINIFTIIMCLLYCVSSFITMFIFWSFAINEFFVFANMSIISKFCFGNWIITTPLICLFHRWGPDMFFFPYSPTTTEVYYSAMTINGLCMFYVSVFYMKN